MLGFEGTEIIWQWRSAQSKPKLGGTGGLAEETHEGAGKGSDGKLSPAAKSPEVRDGEAGQRPAADVVADEAFAGTRVYHRCQVLETSAQGNVLDLGGHHSWLGPLANNQGPASYQIKGEFSIFI